MSKNGNKNKLTPSLRSVCQWHRDKAIHAWLAGKWAVYKRHARIADSITRKG
jgi:hypothetical protein